MTTQELERRVLWVDPNKLNAKLMASQIKDMARIKFSWAGNYDVALNFLKHLETYDGIIMAREKGIDDEADFFITRVLCIEAGRRMPLVVYPRLEGKLKSVSPQQEIPSEYIGRDNITYLKLQPSAEHILKALQDHYEKREVKSASVPQNAPRPA